MAEILEALEEQVRKGNIRYYGCSNWQVDRMQEAAAYAARHSMKGFVCNQCMYTLADVNPAARPDLVILDDATYQYQKETQMSLMAYMCLAGGYFSKRLSGAKISEDQKTYYEYGANEQIAEYLRELEKEGISSTDMMLQYVKQNAFPSVAIVGCSRVEQLLEAMNGIQKTIPQKVMREALSLKKQQYQW